MDIKTKQRLLKFLGSTPVPFSGTRQWEEWQETCNRLVSPDGKSSLIEVLKSEPESLHYAAMMALRMLGIPVGQTGEGFGTKYSIHAADGSVIESFIPAHPPKAPRMIEDIEDDPDWDTRFKK